MMREPRAYLGDGLSVEFDGFQYRLFYHRGDLPIRGDRQVFMDHDMMTKFKAFVELVERAEAYP